MGKGSNTTTQNTSTAPDPNAYQAYLALLNRSAGVASTPYQGFGGQEVAPVNAQQTAGIGNINAVAGPNSPFVQQISNAGQPLTAQQIQNYESPYTKDVINATQAQFNNQNAQQQSQVVGNAAAQGALGGDRVGVAQALTAGQQQLAQAPVIAGLQNQGYNQAVQTAEQQQGIGLQSGVAAQNASLTGANAQVGAGTLEQNTQQAQDTQARQDYYQQQGYPFQVAQWLASIDTGVGSNMGGTGTGVTTGPTPNPFAQVAGLGLAAAGTYFGGPAGGAAGAAAGKSLFGSAKGGRITERVAGFAGGGTPYGDQFQSWVPTGQIHGGSGPPHVSAPSMQKPQGLSSDQMKGIGVLGKDAYNAYDTSRLNSMSDSAIDAEVDQEIPGWRGGRMVRKRYAIGGFADGGDPTFDERFDASYPNFRPTAGIGASAPAFDDPFSGDGSFDVPTPRQERALITAGRRGLGAINPVPGDEFHLDPGATRQAMADTDAINGPDIQQTANDQGAPAPTIAQNDNAPEAGLSAINTAIKAPAAGVGAPDEAMAYGPQDRGLGAPRAESGDQGNAPHGGGLLDSLGIHMTPELRQGLLQAGLSMMATTRGGPGSFLGAAGEAGMAGVGAYNKTLEVAQKQQDLARKEAFEREKFERPYSQLTAEQRETAAHRGEMTDFQQETLKRQALDQAIKMRTPIKIGQTVSGTDIMALPKIGTDGKVDLYPIGADGTVAATPVRPGESIKPSAPVAPTQTTPAAALTKQDTDAPASPQNRNEAFLDSVKKEDPGYAEAIKKAADYELDPNRYASMRKGDRQKFINNVIQYDPSYDSRTYPLRYQAMRAFQPGQKMGDSVRSFNTAIAHLDTLKDLYTSLQNHDSQLYNRVANTFKTQFGYDAPNNVAAAAQLVGGEIVKAVVGSQNALGDREEVRQSISRDLSSGQAVGVINTYTNLMAGQLRSIKKAYEEGTGLHNFDQKYLIPRTVEAVNSVEKPVPLAGDKHNGWTFKGGNPADKKNWTKD